MIRADESLPWNYSFSRAVPCNSAALTSAGDCDRTARAVAMARSGQERTFNARWKGLPSDTVTLRPVEVARVKLRQTEQSRGPSSHWTPTEFRMRGPGYSAWSAVSGGLELANRSWIAAPWDRTRRVTVSSRRVPTSASSWVRPASVRRITAPSP